MAGMCLPKAFEARTPSTWNALCLDIHEADLPAASLIQMSCSHPGSSALLPQSFLLFFFPLKNVLIPFQTPSLIYHVCVLISPSPASAAPPGQSVFASLFPTVLTGLPGAPRGSTARALGQSE